MGRSRRKRNKKKVDTKASNEPRQSAQERDTESLLAWLGEHKEILALAFGGLSTLVYGLGLFSLRSRETLLGLTSSLKYPHEEAVLTGLHVLWRLPWDALAGLTSKNPWLLAGAWGSLALCLLATAVVRRAPRRWRRLRWVAFVVVGLAVLFTHRFHFAALFPPHKQDAVVYPSFDPELSGDPIAEPAFESVSWLINETEVNAHHRAALNGLGAWLLTVSGFWVWVALRQRDLSTRQRWGVVVVFVVLGLSIGSTAPRGYAVTIWGVSYPTVAVEIKDECRSALAKAIASGDCCAYDISTKGEPVTTLLRGTCPEGLPTVLRWDDDQKSCLTAPGQPKVIDDDC